MKIEGNFNITENIDLCKQNVDIHQDWKVTFNMGYSNSAPSGEHVQDICRMSDTCYLISGHLVRNTES